MRWLITVVVVLGLAGTAAADGELTGFVSPAGTLSGQVTSLGGKPVANVKVHVLAASGAETTVTTSKDGRYTVDVPSEGAYVFVRGKARIGGHVAVGDEVIEIHETLAPTKQPKPLTDPTLIPEYSEALADRDYWARAWLMLLVDERGNVTHVKLINKPGLDLDAIAIRDAFKLRFEPARDRANRAMRALVLWSYEWPSYRWMEARNLELDRLPLKLISRVKCKMTRSLRSHHRDCFGPDLVKGFSQPWIAKPRPAKRAK